MHKEYKRIAAQPGKAILFIHGIVGTPLHFTPFLELVPPNYSVYNMLLDGHGKGARDFSKTSMKRWEQQVGEAIEELSRQHTELYVVAHSLGSLLAIEQAIKTGKIKKLFLLAVPVKLSVKPATVTTSMKVFFDKIDPEDSLSVAAKACYGIERDRNPLHYIGWIPRFLELFTKISQIRGMLDALNTPCYAYQSVKDEKVSVKSAAILSRNPHITVTQLKNSAHYYYDGDDLLFLKQEFENFIYELG